MQLGVCTSLTALELSRLERVGEEMRPSRERVVELRARVREALPAGHLLIDCIALELRRLEAGGLHDSLAPFHVDPDSGVQFAFTYWRPGETPGPHEHAAWSISAVCHNELSVTTYDRDESYRRDELVIKNVFHARSGQVGYIYGPAIHSPINSSGDWTVTLHISSPRDIARSFDAGVAADRAPLRGLTPPAKFRWRPEVKRHPYAAVLAARAGRQRADLLARMLLSMDTPRTSDVFAVCARLASSSVRAVLQSQLAAGSSPCGMERRAVRLRRVHPDLSFTLDRVDDEWAILVETPAGPQEALRVNEPAYDALACALASTELDPGALPGTASDEEQLAIADILEDAGLFRRLES